MPNLNLPIARLASAVVSFVASGNNTVIAAVAGKTIRVHRLLLAASAATGITFKDGTTAMSGAIPLLANGSITLDEQTDPWYVTTAGSAFTIASSNAVTVTGTVWYVQS